VNHNVLKKETIAKKVALKVSKIVNSIGHKILKHSTLPKEATKTLETSPPKMSIEKPKALPKPVKRIPQDIKKKTITPKPKVD